MTTTNSATKEKPGFGPGIQKFFTSQEALLFLVIIALGCVMGSINRSFLSPGNLFGLMNNHAFLAILAIGVLVVLISGGIDISFMATASVAQYIMSLQIIAHGGNMLEAFLIAAAAGIILGAVNALFIHWLEAQAIIVTIATMNIFFGALLVISRGKWLFGFPAWFKPSSTSGQWLPFIVAISVYIATWFLLNHTKTGRKIYALGGSIEAAKRVGINVLQIRLFIYGFMGMIAGIAATVQAYVIQNISPSTNIGREMDVLAAVVLGGASLLGGKGSVLGTFFGVLIIAIVSNGLILMHISSYWHTLFIGLIIIASVSMTAYQQRISEERGSAINVQ
ncbi:MAG TPA: sugar ABC transporter permease [Firmicutes bacterium]|jgi:simple sugar transport system permease protein|nr:sugar ABC transporter permease [Bacillota bacterium]